MKIKKRNPSKKPESDFYLKKEMKQSQLLFLSNMGSVLCLVLILAALGMTTLQSRAADAANHDRYILTECATYFMNASSYLTGEVRAYAATGDKVHADNYLNELETVKTREKAVEQMEALGITSQERAQIDEMLALSNSLVPTEKQAIADAAAGQTRAAVGGVLSLEYINTVSRIQEAKLEFLTTLSSRTTAQVQQSVAATRVLESVTACLIVLVAVLQIAAYGLTKRRVILPIRAVEQEMRNLSQGRLSEEFLCQPNTSEIGMMVESILVMRRNLKRYIGDISEKLTRMADKDMTVSVDLDYMGDFAPIRASMNRIILSMNDILGQVVTAASDVATGAVQVSSSAQALAAGTTEQASTLGDVSNTMARISEQVEQSASQARTATALANAAGVQLGQSNEQLQGMLNAMREISDASGEIGKIIKTIEDIAFQTDILALNAAVEAARAGMAGKGFAVVADEVRSLANKSAEASKNTSAMIENSLRTIQSGAEIAQSASNTFVEVMVNAGKAAEAMGSITEASEKQFQAFAELARSMEQIAGVVQSHASVSEETATISEEMNAQADSLHSIVRQFHLKGGKDDRHIWDQAAPGAR